MEETIEQNQFQEELNDLRNHVLKVKNEVHKVIVGQDKMIDLFLAALFTKGHVLLEGVPGIAKTLTAKLLAKTISVDFSRIQFTPDLMPSDVIGTSVFNMKNSEFVFNQGPVFSNVVLIDEINRSPAKTQASLFEVMEERQVTVDGQTYLMEFPFMVVATQNPIEQEGTYKLPEAQLDRFLFRVKLEYPSLDDEKIILKRFKEDFSLDQNQKIAKVLNKTNLKKCQEIIEKIHIKDELLDYIAALVHNTRNNGDLFLGASPRASLAIMKSAKAIAAMKGREFVIPDDIQFVAYPVLNHRIMLTAEREMEGFEVEDIIKGIIQNIEVPR
ncbi:MoxR family ATPase [Fulvivirgaceae bacterium BMA10]|uniref:MoxR family ATPase n=1 Tax=Splendidivirga corallicola TaxID=3051826 RepID=A0ABT8KVD7_9BACT|nr:MoxR family ATPase [Fulvivirgaceae bacterium BMA10]